MDRQNELDYNLSLVKSHSQIWDTKCIINIFLGEKIDKAHANGLEIFLGIKFIVVLHFHGVNIGVTMSPFTFKGLTKHVLGECYSVMSLPQHLHNLFTASPFQILLDFFECLDGMVKLIKAFALALWRHIQVSSCLILYVMEVTYKLVSRNFHLVCHVYWIR